MKKTILVAGLLLMTIFTSNAQSTWELIYHNDKNGETVEGNISELIRAIRNGKEIRMAWWFQHPLEEKIKVEHLADAAFLTIASDSIVYGQIKPIYGQIPDFDNAKVTLKENLEWVMIGGTNGKWDTMTRNMTTGETISHELRKTDFKWYVRD